MEVRLLGPLEVIVGGHAIPLGGARQRALLAILALHADEVVPARRLIDELWPDDIPESALNTLQGYVSRLRKALDAEGTNGQMIAYRSGGYVLRLEPENVDSHRFVRLVDDGETRLDAGDASGASSLLRDALGLWRGAALADFTGEPFAEAEIARLDELRLKAVEDRIDAELARGRHATVVAELEALVASHPLRERPRRQLMLALYRSGRQGEALDVYRDARAALDEALGVEPTPELRELERAILRHDPSLGAATRVAPVGHRRRATNRLWIAGVAVLVAAALAAAVFSQREADVVAIRIVPNSVAVVDARTGDLVDDVVVGDYPGPIAAGNGSVWVGNVGANTMTEIDARTREAEFPAGVQRPLEIAVTREAVWVANASDFQTEPPSGGGTIERRALRSGALTTTQLGPRDSLDQGSTFVASQGRSVWAANVASHTVARLDPRTGRIVARAEGVDGGAIAIGYGAVWVVETARNTVARVDPRTAAVVARIPVSGGPARVAAGEGAIWVLTAGTRSALWRIDPHSNEVIAVLPVPPTSQRVATGAGYVWVTSGRSDAEFRIRAGRGLLSKIDPRANRLLSSIPIGFRPDGVVVARNLVWVAVAPP